jgi:hypothetical protein
MPTPTVTHPTTRPAVGLTGKGRAASTRSAPSPFGLTAKGRAVVLLAKVRDNWETFTPEQWAEVAELVARLAAALRQEKVATTTFSNSRPRVPLVGRISA